MPVSYGISALTRGAATLDGIISSSVSSGVTNFLETGDDAPFGSFLGVSGMAPVLSYQTAHIATHLGITGVDGLAITGTPLVAHFVERSTDGVRESAGASASLYAGMLLPRTIEASQGQIATLSCEAVAPGDDANAPLAFGAVAPPAYDEQIERYTLGPILVDGTDAGYVQSCSIEFGIDYQLRRGGDMTWAQYGFIAAFRPTIRFTTLDATRAAAWGASGAALPVSVQLTALSQTTTTGRAASGHITFATTKSRVVANPLGGSGDSATEVMITPAWDGTNHPITVTGV